MSRGLHNEVLTAAAVVVPLLLEDGEFHSITIRAGGADVEVEIGFPEEVSGFYCVFPGRGHTDVQHVVFHLFEELQDFVAESVFAWGQARPVCPGHRHPRRLIYAGSGLWWACPVNDRHHRERAFDHLSHSP